MGKVCSKNTYHVVQAMTFLSPTWNLKGSRITFQRGPLKLNHLKKGDQQNCEKKNLWHKFFFNHDSWEIVLSNFPGFLFQKTKTPTFWGKMVIFQPAIGGSQRCVPFETGWISCGLFSPGFGELPWVGRSDARWWKPWAWRSNSVYPTAGVTGWWFRNPLLVPTVAK